MKGINLYNIVNLEKSSTLEYIKGVVDNAKYNGCEMIFGFKYIEAIQDYRYQFSENRNFNENELIQGEKQLINAVKIYNSINSSESRN